jgi:two-component system, NtrC family, response regulator PilR
MSSRRASACSTLARFTMHTRNAPLVTRPLPVPEVATGLTADAVSGAGFSLLGQSALMRGVREQIARIAPGDAPVAISGESGSGKELAARDLHQHSRRAAQAFVAVNCGAIPEALMESEFFGHRRGAFTGAHEERGGFFQAAHRGTLFLDEVAELPPAMQVKLLRAIQERRVRKLGGQREEAVDVRLLSATNRDLAAAVRRGEFRQDLYYRLQVIELRLPPLRERRDDIPLLAGAILSRLAGARAPRLLPAALQKLHAHDFPGNVRELENILERALALASGDELGPAELLFEAASAATAVAAGTTDAVPTLPMLPLSLPAHLAAVERELLLRALRQSCFDRRRAADLLGISLRQLRYRIQRLDLDDCD